MLRDGALAARDGAIVWVGREAELAREPSSLGDDAVELDAERRLRAPGLRRLPTRTPCSPARAPTSTASGSRGVSYAEILGVGGGINATVRGDARRRARPSSPR